MIRLNSISAEGDPELKPSWNSCPAEPPLHKFRVIMTPVWLMSLNNELEEGCCSYARCRGHKQEIQAGATPGNNKIYCQTIAPFRVETLEIYKTPSRCSFTAVWTERGSVSAPGTRHLLKSLCSTSGISSNGACVGENTRGQPTLRSILQ